MKQVFFLLIGILAFSVACQDNFVELENDLTPGTKSAKYEKVKTFPVKGWINIVPDPEAPMFACTPAEAGVEMCSSGWIRGILTGSGKIVEEQSTYEKQSCDVTMTEAGPVILNVVKAIVTSANGDKMFAESHTYINPVTGKVWGQTDILDGTGRYEGATGTLNQLNGKILSDGGLSWDSVGEITLVLK